MLVFHGIFLAGLNYLHVAVGGQAPGSLKLMGQWLGCSQLALWLLICVICLSLAVGVLWSPTCPVMLLPGGFLSVALCGGRLCSLLCGLVH